VGKKKKEGKRSAVRGGRKRGDVLRAALASARAYILYNNETKAGREGGARDRLGRKEEGKKKKFFVDRGAQKGA